MHQGVWEIKNMKKVTHTLNQFNRCMQDVSKNGNVKK